MQPNIRFRNKDFDKLANILQLPVEMLQKLEAMNLLNIPECRNLLILTDWRLLKKNKEYTTFQITEALSNEYQISESTVEKIIYAKKKSQYWCEECRKRISKSESLRNEGVCDKCIVKSIKI
jgi:formylmethanofuran dehydrogenase subunit E